MRYRSQPHHYRRGGLGDVKIKKFLINILEDFLQPFREKRKYYEENIELVYQILKEGCKKASDKADQTLAKVKDSMKINYFDENNDEIIKKYK